MLTSTGVQDIKLEIINMCHKFTLYVHAFKKSLHYLIFAQSHNVGS
jgi:hypothetical protein